MVRCYSNIAIAFSDFDLNGPALELTSPSLLGLTTIDKVSNEDFNNASSQNNISISSQIHSKEDLRQSKEDLKIATLSFGKLQSIITSTLSKSTRSLNEQPEDNRESLAIEKPDITSASAKTLPSSNLLTELPATNELSKKSAIGSSSGNLAKKSFFGSFNAKDSKKEAEPASPKVGKIAKMRDSLAKSFQKKSSDSMLQDYESEKEITTFQSPAKQLVLEEEQAPIQIFITFRDTRICIQFLTSVYVEEILQKAINNLLDEIKLDDTDYENYIFWKYDQINSYSRVWLSNKRKLRSYGLVQGDELSLAHIDDREECNLIFTGSLDPIQFDYGINMKISDAIMVFMSEGYITPTLKYAIYHSRYGIWLDDAKKFCDYTILKEDFLQIKELSLERIIKINLVEFDGVQFGVKIIPSMTGRDLCCMLANNITQKKLEMNSRGYYSLYNTKTSVWIEDDRAISFYDEKTTLVSSLDYKIRYQVIFIQFGKDLHPYFTEAATTASMLFDTFSSAGFCNNDQPCGLYNMAGELLKGSELIWSLFKDFASDDYLIYKMQPQKLLFKCSISEDSASKIDVRFDIPVSQLLPLISRKFGVPIGEIYRIVNLKDNNGI